MADPRALVTWNSRRRRDCRQRWRWMASLCLVVLSALMSVHPDNHVLVSETCEVVGISEEVEVMPILGVNLNPSVKPIQCPPGQELALLLPVSMRSDPTIMEMNEEVNEEVAMAVAMEENVGAVGGNMAGTEKAENERATGVVIVLIVLRMLHHVLLQDPNQTERQSLEPHDPEKRYVIPASPPEGKHDGKHGRKNRRNGV